MNIFSGLKIKYRLLLVVFLPTLLLVGFLFSFLHENYQTIQQAESVDDVMAVINKVIHVNHALQDEGTLSKTALAYEKSEVRPRLIAARPRVDHALSSLRDEINQISNATEKNWYNDAVKPIFSKLDNLGKRRSEIDGKLIGAIPAFDYYNNIENDVSETINKLMDKVNDYPMTRRLTLLLAVAQDQLTNSNITHIVLEGLYEGKITPEEFRTLLEDIGKQKGVQAIATDIALPTEESLISEFTNKEAWRTVERLQNSVIAKGMTGPYSVTPQDWIQAQDSKSDVYFSLMDAIIALNQKSIEQFKKEYFTYLIAVGVISTIIVSLVLLLVLASLRGLAKKLEDEIGVLSNSGEEILHSISEASSGVVETAAAVTETTTTVEELKQTAQVSAEKAKNVAEVSDEALTTLQSSEKTIADTIEWMNRIHDGMGTISESIVKLSEHGKMIREIIDAVNDLAEQSHLLAVNAAIEAAKAGDQGKGFAVVAQEVRTLADQSKQATVQVRNILNDIQNATNAAVMATEQGSKAVGRGLAQSAQTGESIRSLAIGINNVAQAAAQISLSSQQQLVGVNQVTTAMANIKTASDQHVEHMRQIEGGVQGLNTVGKSLKEQVVQYKI